MSKQSKPTREQIRAEIKARLLAAPELSDRAIARGMECSPSTVGAVRRELPVQDGQPDTQSEQGAEWMSHPYLKQHPKLLESLKERGLRAVKSPGVLDLMMEKGLSSPIYALRVLRKQEKAARKRAAGVEISEDNIIIKQGDLLSGLEFIPDKCVSVILTDLPYDGSKETLSLYSALGRIAARTLTETGVLACMCGNSHLPAFMSALGEHLRYNWTICVETPRKATALHFKHISTYWKPVLIYTVSGAYKGDLISDLIKSPADADGADKLHHHWGQSDFVFSELADRFIQNPGAVLLDPCCGAGTSLLAGIRTGLCSRVIGVDIDAECVKVTRRRVDALYGAGVDE